MAAATISRQNTKQVQQSGSDPAIQVLSPARHRFLFYRGRIALYSLLRALKIGAGDEVIVQAYTCWEAVQPILQVGATPVFCDTEPFKFNMDPKALVRTLSKATKAVIIQHTFGIPAKLDSLMPLLKERGLFAIEDCCHVCSSEYNGLPVGSFGDAAFYSYAHEKPISGGLGGAVVLNSQAHAAAFQSLYEASAAPSTAEELWAAFRIAAKVIFPAEIVVTVRDYVRGDRIRTKSPERWPDFECKRHLPKIAAFWVNHLLARTAKITKRKLRTINKLDQHIAALGLRHPAVPEQRGVVLWRYPLLTRNKPELLKRARQCAIRIVDWGSVPFQWEGQLNHNHKFASQTFPNALELAETTATIPIGFGLSGSYINKVVRFLSRMSAEGNA